MPGTLPEVDPAIAEYYSRAPEEHRLQEGASLLESLRTRELIGRFAARPPAVVLDIGGAAGAYALWLAGEGYEIHLVDPIQRLVCEAERRSKASTHPIASCQVGDARSLPFADRCADAVLLLGPLYHLTSWRERAKAIEESARVLKKGGYLFAAGISRWASVMDGLAGDLFADPRFAAITEIDLHDGQHRNDCGKLDYFTTSYFHRPEDLRLEVRCAGLEVVGLFGVEGPGWILPDLRERLADPRRRQDLLRVARQVESEPSMIGTSAHLMAVARKNG
jgi:SAM-dependent methyltransferase